MQIHQILVRPREHTVIVLYEDVAKVRNSVIFDSAGDATVNKLIEECQARVPADADRPDKSVIEEEIRGLESRLDLLRQSIGAP